MEKIKLTKGELKKQRDALRQYERFLPTLQLKKQQLQMEILQQNIILEEKKRIMFDRKRIALVWSGLLSEEGIDIKILIGAKEARRGVRNIAGVELPVFEGVKFEPVGYDLFSSPLWVDHAIEQLQQISSLQVELETIEQGVVILRQELRITAQRVNLFEKVKIPEAEEAIRLIKIYLGDQMTNAVGRSKIAKRKIEELDLAGVGA